MPEPTVSRSVWNNPKPAQIGNKLHQATCAACDNTSHPATQAMSLKSRKGRDFYWR